MPRRPPGVVAIVDDILGYGKTREEYDQNLCNVIKRSLEKGIRFNEDKLVVGVQQVDFVSKGNRFDVY